MLERQARQGDLLIVIRHAPQGSAWVREGVEMALVGGTLGQQVGVLFQGDGVLALLANQSAGALGQKSTLPMIDVLEMYDIGPLWVDAQALLHFGLTVADFAVDVQTTRVKEILACYDQCYLF